jgi:hypothetical protein
MSSYVMMRVADLREEKKRWCPCPLSSAWRRNDGDGGRLHRSRGVGAVLVTDFGTKLTITKPDFDPDRVRPALDDAKVRALFAGRRRLRRLFRRHDRPAGTSTHARWSGRRSRLGSGR